METQHKVKILPEMTPAQAWKLQTYSLRPRMDDKSRQQNATKWVLRPHSCPNSPSMISNADELSPPSAYFRNRSSGLHNLSRNHVGAAENSILPIEKTRRNNIEVMYYAEPISPKISCTGHIKLKKKQIKHVKGVEVKKHVTLFRRMLFNVKRSKSEVRSESDV